MACLLFKLFVQHLIVSLDATLIKCSLNFFAISTASVIKTFFSNDEKLLLFHL